MLKEGLTLPLISAKLFGFRHKTRSYTDALDIKLCRKSSFKIAFYKYLISN